DSKYGGEDDGERAHQEIVEQRLRIERSHFFRALGARRMRVKDRLLTRVDRTMEVDVVPKGVSLSIRLSRCCTDSTATFRVNESAPVPRWHSRTSGMSRTAFAMREKTSPTTLMRMKAAMGRPILAGLTSARKPVMMPASSILRTRSATAGRVRPTRRPSSANDKRPFCCRCSRICHPVSSSVELSKAIIVLYFIKHSTNAISVNV